jgi:hypothetical protein
MKHALHVDSIYLKLFFALIMNTVLTVEGTSLYRSIQNSEIAYGVTDDENVLLQKHNTRGVLGERELVYGRSTQVKLNMPELAYLQGAPRRIRRWLPDQHMIWGNAKYRNIHNDERLFPSNFTNWRVNKGLLSTEFIFNYIAPMQIPNTTVTSDSSAYSSIDFYKRLTLHAGLRNHKGDLVRNGPSPKNIIVLCHGWNPSSNTNPFNTNEFQLLISNLSQRLTGTDWVIVPYNWGWDSATGGAIINRNGSFITGSATNAAEIGHVHGLALGKNLLELNNSNLQNVHFIAHSAGSWVARSALRHLSLHSPNTNLQITFLDPYVPGRANDLDSTLSGIRISNMRTWSGIEVMENYYSYDYIGAIRSTLVLGTDGNFNWGGFPNTKQWATDSSGRSDWGFRNIDSHSAPIEFYADTITDPSLSQKYGWRNSMFYRSRKTNNSSPGGTIQNSTFRLNWSAVGQANGYEVTYIRLDGKVSRKLRVSNTQTPLISPPPGTYRWYIQALRDGKTFGPKTEQQPFTVLSPEAPTLLAPKGRTDSRSFKFQWLKARRATHYQLVIRRKIPRSSPERYQLVYNKLIKGNNLQKSGNILSLEPGFRFASGQYTWTVRSYNDKQKTFSPYAISMGYFINGLEAPVAKTPGGTETLPNVPFRFNRTFRWSATKGANAYQIMLRTYEPWFNPRVQNYNLTKDFKLTDKQHRFGPFKESIRYDWKVRSYIWVRENRFSVKREFSPWSNTLGFRVNEGLVTGGTNVTVTTTPTLVSFWDNETIDQDIIDIYLNGRLIRSNVELFRSPLELNLPFVRGRNNTIELVAKSVGTVGPCTVAIQISNVTSGRSFQTWDLDLSERGGISVFVR